MELPQDTWLLLEREQTKACLSCYVSVPGTHSQTREQGSGGTLLWGPWKRTSRLLPPKSKNVGGLMLKSCNSMPGLFSEAYLKTAIHIAYREREEISSREGGYQSSLMEESWIDCADSNHKGSTISNSSSSSHSSVPCSRGGTNPWSHLPDHPFPGGTKQPPKCGCFWSTYTK